MKEWMDVLDIELLFDIDTATGKPKVNLNPRVADDGINTILYSNTAGLMTAYSIISSCDMNLSYTKGIDIEISNMVNWYKDTNSSISSNQFSFYTTFLHELGHALNLRHTLNLSDLMDPGISSGEIKQLDANAIAGGKHSVKISSDTNIQWMECDMETGLKSLNFENDFCQMVSSPIINVHCTHTTPNAIKVEWDAVNGASSYLLEYSLSPDFYPLIGSFTLPFGTYMQLVTGLTPSTEYYFRVKAGSLSGGLGTALLKNGLPPTNPSPL